MRLNTSMNDKDWGMEKSYLYSTRQHLWNNDYFEFLVKYVWKIDKPVRIIVTWLHDVTSFLMDIKMRLKNTRTLLVRTDKPIGKLRF